MTDFDPLSDRLSPERAGMMLQVKSQRRYRLRDNDGYLHSMDLTARTSDLRHAWIGFKHQLDTVRKRYPETRRMTLLAVAPPASKGAW